MRRRLVAAATLAVFGAMVLAQHHGRAAVAQHLEHWLRALHGLGAAGMAATAALQFLVAALGVVPASLMGIAAGAAYGFFTGFAISAAGLMAGALAAFLLSRSVLRPTIARLLERRLGWHQFDHAIAGEGWRVVCLIRLSPVMPFAIASYSLGLSSIATRAYMIGTTASLPALGLYVLMGALAHRSVGLADPWLRALLWVGAGATLLLGVKIGAIAMRLLKQR